MNASLRGPLVRRVQAGYLSLLAAWPGYAVALLSVALVSVVVALVERRILIANLSLLYLIAVLSTASVFGSGPAIAAAVFAFLAFDFLFVEPRYSITVADPAEWLALLMFLATAIITGQLAANQRRRAEEARAREREAVLLYDVLRLMQGPELTAALQAVATRLQAAFHVDTVGIVVREGPAGKPIRVIAGAPVPASAFELIEGQMQVLQEGPLAPPEQVQPTGHWVSIVPPRASRRDRPRISRYHIPLKAEKRRVGSLMLFNLGQEIRFTPSDNRLLLAVATQLAATLEREHLRREATEAEILRRTDELKTALLNAVSHDLRTPLASIIAAAESLQQDDVAWTEEERREFLQMIADEARRLDQLVSNLLDLSRIQAGKLQLEKHWRDMGTLMTDVVARLRPRLAAHRLVTQVPNRLPPVPVDELRISQVLVNLIENAAKYSPPGSTITISARQVGQDIEVAVEDEGPGIPLETALHLFAPFYRAGGDGARPQGTGLGLVIAKHLVEVHGGRIWAENRPSGGARFAFTIPLAEHEHPVPTPAESTP